MLTDAEKRIVVRWLIENDDYLTSSVPADEGNDIGLLFNLVSLAIHGPEYERYDYQDDQDEAVAKWRAGEPPG